MDLPDEQGANDLADRARDMLRIVDDLQIERRRLAKEIDQRRRAEQLARAVINSALDAVISMDSSGHIVEWNVQAESIFGWTRSEAEGQELASLIMPPQHRRAYLAGLARYSETGDAPVLGQRLELTALRKTGEEFPVEFSVVAVPFDETVLFNAFLRDITQRSADVEYRARMAALVDSSYDAIIGKDVDGTIISWNVGAERVYGYSEAEAIGKTIAIILPPDIEREELQILHALQTGQRLEQFETVRRRKNEELIPVSVNVSPIADDRGEIIGSSSIERDIADRKHAEIAEAEHKHLMALRVDVSTALAANQSLRAALQQCTQSLVKHLDAAFARIWTLNEQNDMLELQASAGLYAHLDGPHSRIKMGQYKIGRIAQKRQPHLTNEVPNDPNISSPAWAKREGMVAFAGYPLMIGERVLGVVAMFARQTLSKTILSQLVPLADGIAQYLERKRNEDELRRAKEAAEQAARARAEFLANVSHELRTPMNAIIGMTQIALGEDLTEGLRDYVQTANDAAHSLLELLNDILDFSKLESGKFKIEEEPFNLRETLAETVKTLSARAFEKGLELVCDVAHETPDKLTGDALRLRQVLTNLIANAIKFTEQGEIAVSVATLHTRPQGAQLRFAVRDTGIGISAQDQQRMLEPFTQADASSTRHYGGTGLGLAICSELLHLMGSHLSVESELGRGSCFSFELSWARPADSSREPAEITPPYRLQDTTVLIVDDNETNRRILAEMLTNWSMRPHTAAGGEEALEKLERACESGAPYRLVLVDALMPEMDGYALSRQIVERWPTPPPVILMVSSSDRQEFKEREVEAEVATFLQKPVSQSDLMYAVMRAMHVEVLDAKSEAGPRVRGTSHVTISVLLAEDTPANQKVVTSILKKRGHAVTVAQNGREAVELFRKQNFDAVLMDVQMPIMDGFQAAAAIREQQRDSAHSTPIIAMTAHAMRGDREKCLKAGMDAYIAKPVDVNQLLELVENLAESTSVWKSEANEPVSKDAIHQCDENIAADGPQASRVEASTVDLEGAMRRLAGDMDLFRDFIDYFDEDSPKLLSTLREAIAQANVTSVRRAAHSLRGLAANFGAQGCVAAAHAMELLGKSGDLKNAGDSLSRLEREVARLDNALAEYRT